MKSVNRLPELIKRKQDEVRQTQSRELSEVEIAVNIGINPATLSRYKTGKVESINWKVWTKLCEYFKVEGHEIFDIRVTNEVIPHKKTMKGRQ